VDRAIAALGPADLHAASVKVELSPANRADRI
jgi:hypothetical protein